ncbi:MAG TPA: hypothetical protein VMT34_16845 [Aggregatilineales bacterium]|nr:hypothetical protein [Aggregatilineales bacterium]
MDKLDNWEAVWSPYTDDIYQAALAMLCPDDVVLDIGAGDLRFSRLAASKVRRVTAIEQNRDLLGTAPIAHNLTAIGADARIWNFPNGISVAVLLMRHCTCFAHYVAKLRGVGCGRLITNARWRTGVECVSLAPKPTLQTMSEMGSKAGWYACLCGATGFVAATPEGVTPEALNRTLEVEGCPRCVRDSTTLRKT